MGQTTYRSAKNEAHLEANGFKSRIHRKKPQGKPMPKHVSRANAAKSEVRAHVEHVFARQKGPMALVIRTIGLARISHRDLREGREGRDHAGRAAAAQGSGTAAHCASARWVLGLVGGVEGRAGWLGSAA